MLNTYTTANQEVPRVDHDAQGNFVAVWASKDQDGSGFGVFARALDSTGVSDVGAFDMVGNLREWVADWVPASTVLPSSGCPEWGGFSDDLMCLTGATTTATGPGAPIRGGGFGSGVFAGPFSVDGGFQPSFASSGAPGNSFGFRCARRL
jgi:formylglycine-generating enzyme required for sulfatase activity